MMRPFHLARVERLKLERGPLAFEVRGKGVGAKVLAHASYIATSRAEYNRVVKGVPIGYMTSMAKARYCKAWNAGLASEQGAVNRRLSRLFAALESEINSNIVEGKVNDDIRAFTQKLKERLARDGYTVRWDFQRNKPKVTFSGGKQ
jgi:hypothetical protein